MSTLDLRFGSIPNLCHCRKGCPAYLDKSEKFRILSKNHWNMPVNKNAKARYDCLERCFRDTKRRYFIKDLIKECGEAVKKAGCADTTVSRSQVYADIKFLMNEYPGMILKGKDHGQVYYYCNDKAATRPMSLEETKYLSDTIQTLDRFRGLPQFKALDDAAKHFNEFALGWKPGVVGFESNEDLWGIDNFDGLFTAIVHRQVLRIMYASGFGKPEERIFHPYYLKQFNCRWFLIGHEQKAGAVRLFALDRIESYSVASDIEYIPYTGDIEDYFNDVVGVTVMENVPVQEIEFEVYDKKTFDYLRTKPFHHSLFIEKEYVSPEEPARIKVTVRPNLELEAVLLRYADNIRILSPESFRERFLQRVRKILERNE